MVYDGGAVIVCNSAYGLLYYCLFCSVLSPGLHGMRRFMYSKRAHFQKKGIHTTGSCDRQVYCTI